MTLVRTSMYRFTFYSVKIVFSFRSTFLQFINRIFYLRLHVVAYVGLALTVTRLKGCKNFLVIDIAMNKKISRILVSHFQQEIEYLLLL
jgi:hypothetical protein